MKNVSINHQPSFSAKSSITDLNEFVYSTNHALDVNITGSIVTGDINLAEVGGSPIALGQTTMSGSFPVTIASNQSTLPISGTVIANAGTGNFSTNVTQIAGNSVATAASGIQKIGLTDGSGNAITSTAGALDVNATFSGTVNSAPTYKYDPTDALENPKYGKVNSGTLQQEIMAVPYNSSLTEIGTALDPIQVSLANTGSNATAVTVDGSGGTFPISGTIAVTQSTSPWIIAGGGTAGSAASGVVSIQGIASMTPVQVSQSTASNLNATVVQSTGSNLHAVIDSGTITTITNPVTVMATNLSTNIAQINGSTVQTGHGTATGALRVELPTDGTGVIAAVTAITNALPVGTNSIGKISDITTSVTPGTAATNLGKPRTPDIVLGIRGLCPYSLEMILSQL